MAIALYIALAMALDLMLVFPCTPLLSSRHRHSTVQYRTIQYSTVQYRTVQCITIQCVTVQYSTLQLNTVHYGIVQYSTVQICKVQQDGGVLFTWRPGFPSVL